MTQELTKFSDSSHQSFYWWGCFVAQEQEYSYRLVSLRDDVKRGKLVIQIGIIVCLVFLVSDYFFVGFSELFVFLALLRLLSIALSLATFAILRQRINPVDLDWIIAFWSVATLIQNLLIVSSRPEGYLTNSFFNVLLILLLYCVIPLTLRIQIFLGFIGTVCYLAAFFYINRNAILPTQLAIVFSYMIVNSLGIVISRDLNRFRRRIFAEMEEEKSLRTSLEKALAEIRTLRGILPICADCKKVRDDQGYWQQVEVYVRDHTYAEFTHGICPDCMERLYGDELRKLLSK